MDEPRTHYQLSFTSRQALWLFVLLLLSLGVAFFLGLMAGLARRPEGPGSVARPAVIPEAVAAAPEAKRPANAPEPAGTAESPSRTRLGDRRETPSAPERAPSTLATFDDRGSSERPPASRPQSGASAAPAPASGFWVQVLSSRSEKEAASRRARYASHGFPAAVQPAPGPGGTVYRVRLGPYASREEAARAADRVRAAEKVEPWIVPSGS